MKWKLQEIQREREIAFDESIALTEVIQSREPSILSLSALTVKGTIRFEDGYYDLVYTASYTITLPSSRSLTPVAREVVLDVAETFSDAASADENEAVLALESDEISLDDSLADNVLLEIPLQILTADEEKNEKLPSGNAWQVLSEEDYAALQKEEKQKSNPFSNLGKIFEEN
ncbi:MAG: YceD family protein [Streptococcaceae bacterium]|jgi:uncharacterized protein|nr:YceD family protein [Streptococcaceae bacterium]